jgi:hypothetical protein
MQKWDISQNLFLKNTYGSGEIAAFFTSNYNNSVFKTCTKRSLIESEKLSELKKLINLKV